MGSKEANCSNMDWIKQIQSISSGGLYYSCYDETSGYIILRKIFMVFQEQVVYPKLAQSKDDKWLYVINQDTYIQGIRIEKCA